MLSAHGSAPEVVAAARANGGFVVDAVCPLVTKVHHEVKVRAGKGYQIVYVGHEGHEEAVGTMAVAPDAIHRVESVAEVDALPGLRHARGPAGPDHPQPPRLGRASPTAPRSGTRTCGARDAATCASPPPTGSRRWARSPSACDAVVVIGSANSSNTRALEQLARESGARGSTASTAPTSCPPDLTGTIGVTAGASAPEELVQSVIARLGPAEGVEEVRITDEDEYFPPPRELRDLLAAVDVLATLAAGGSIPDRPGAARPRPGRQRGPRRPGVPGHRPAPPGQDTQAPLKAASAPHGALRAGVEGRGAGGRG